MSFEKRTVIVTGAAKGMGRAIAEGFYREGASVVLLDVDPEGAVLADSFGPRGLFVQCDVSRGPEVRGAFAAGVRRFGGVDILVNNVGIMRYGTVTETSDEEWDQVLTVNLKSAFLCAKEVIPLLLERGRGVIINIASVQSFLSQARAAAYTTSKSALLGLTRSIAIDYAPTLRCVAVCPGAVDTPMLHWAAELSSDPQAVLRKCDQMHLTQRIAQPEEIAELVLYLAGDKAAFITGQSIRIDGGLGIAIPGSQCE